MPAVWRKRGFGAAALLFAGEALPIALVASTHSFESFGDMRCLCTPFRSNAAPVASSVMSIFSLTSRPLIRDSVPFQLSLGRLCLAADLM